MDLAVWIKRFWFWFDNISTKHQGQRSKILYSNLCLSMISRSELLIRHNFLKTYSRVYRIPSAALNIITDTNLLVDCSWSRRSSQWLYINTRLFSTPSGGWICNWSVFIFVLFVALNDYSSAIFQEKIIRAKLLIINWLENTVLCFSLNVVLWLHTYYIRGACSQCPQ